MILGWFAQYQKLSERPPHQDIDHPRKIAVRLLTHRNNSNADIFSDSISHRQGLVRDTFHKKKASISHD